MFFWQWMGKQPPKRKRSFLHLQVHFRCKRNPGIFGTIFNLDHLYYSPVGNFDSPRSQVAPADDFPFFFGRVRPNESCEGYVTNILAKQSCFANRNSVYIGCFVEMRWALMYWLIIISSTPYHQPPLGVWSQRSHFHRSWR